MAIHLYRSNRTERLVDALCQVLEREAPADPFQTYPVVVGSRGMERWLRHEIATRMGIAARLDFPFPRPALEGAARWLLDPDRAPQSAFWKRSERTEDALDTERIAFSVVGRLRAHRAHPDFAAVARYLELDAAPSSVASRELVFASNVAGVLSKMVVDRGTEALAWARQPDAAPPQHRWLATLLRDLRLHELRQSSPQLVERLSRMRASAPPQQRSMCVFGLSTMSPGDRQQLQAVSESMPVHLFVMTPTDQWMGDLASDKEHARNLRQATSDEERRAADAAREEANPILSALGMPSRDLQSWLEEVGYREGPSSLFQSDPRPSLLHRLQAWIRDALPAPPESAELPEAKESSGHGGDISVECHAAYGALRQCEALRDRLLDLFHGDASIEPRDVLVMTPDIQTYAPLLTAVFSRTPRREGAAGRRLPEIPVAMADLGLRHTNPIAGALLAMVALAGERLKASWMVDFMSLEPVRRRFGLGDDLAELQGLLQVSGFRWGADAEERASFDQPALDQNTARFAMERLALGVLMPDEDATGPTLEGGELLGAVTALDVRGRDRIEQVGRVCALLRAVMWHREQLSEPTTAAQWRQRCGRALDELTAVSTRAAWLRVEVNAVLDELVEHAAVLDDLPLDRQALQSWLQGRFEIRRSGDRRITGAVQVCAMEPMRSVPFKVVALLGMNDGAFPRGTQRSTWDPTDQQRRSGERDRREVDRHLLLEALLSAREHLLIFWTGYDALQGKKQPAAVPVEELCEVLSRLERTFSVRRHALQPWSERYFQGAVASFDGGLANAATQLREIRLGHAEPRRIGLMASTEAPLPETAELTPRLDLDSLARWLAEPQKKLLNERLQVSLSSDDVTVDDREPLALQTLETWSVRDTLLKARLDVTMEGGPDTGLVQRAKERLRGEGQLPLEAGAEALLSKEDALAQAVIANLAALKAGFAAPLEVSLELSGGLHVYGRVERVRQQTGGERRILEWFTASRRPNARGLLTGWVHLVAAVAAGHPVDGARLVGHEEGSADGIPGYFLAAPTGADAARAILDDLVTLWRRARQVPLRLFQGTSKTLGEELYRCRDDLATPQTRSHLARVVRNAWASDGYLDGDVGRPEIRAFFETYEPWEELEATLRDGLQTVDPWGLVGLAQRVWVPLAQALEAAPERLSEWIGTGDAS